MLNYLCSANVTDTLMWTMHVSSTLLKNLIMSKNFTSPSELGTPELNPLETFVCGAFSGVTASVITQPADVVKTRLQLFPHKYSSTGSAVFCILKVKLLLTFLITKVCLFICCTDANCYDPDMQNIESSIF